MDLLVIFVARCADCGCAVMYLEISEGLSASEKTRREALVHEWRNSGAGVDTQEDPLSPDELGIHADGCGKSREYRHGPSGD